MQSVHSHGSHVFLDYVGYTPCDNDEGGWMLSIMRNAVANTKAREVHSHVERFDGRLSPPGFAAVVLIDESHVTAHCYSDRGWLAIDCFTCGQTNPEAVADYIHSMLVSQNPNIQLMRRDVVARFLNLG